MSRGSERIDDSWLYDDADTLMVEALLFGVRTCLWCGRRLPRCGDYFTPTASSADGLKPVCKRCTRAAYRESNKVRRQAGRDAAKAARCEP